MARQPRADSRNIGKRRTKLLAHFVRRKPMVKIRRVRIVLARDERIEGRLHFRAALQHQDQVRHRHTAAYPARIVLRNRPLGAYSLSAAVS